jgi:predicted transcriptional regulator
MDELTQQIYKVVKNSNEPLTTDEIVDAVKQPRHLVIHRLRNLAMEGKIRGKQTKERGTWIWWHFNQS